MRTHIGFKDSVSENGLIVEEDAYASRLCATQFLVFKTLLQTLP